MQNSSLHGTYLRTCGMNLKDEEREQKNENGKKQKGGRIDSNSASQAA